MSKAWLKCYEPLDRPMLDDAVRVLAASGIEPDQTSHPEASLGLVLLCDVSAGLIDWLERATRHATVLALVVTETGLAVDETWQLMSAGAADVIVWQRVPPTADDISARIDRVHEVSAVMRSPALQRQVVGSSAPWLSTMRDVVEVGAFTDASVLIEGESGTGKELLAQLVHELDRRAAEGRLRHPRLRRRSRRSCRAASSSATSAARSRARSTRETARSRWPTAARCSSTRSGSCRCTLQAAAAAGRAGAQYKRVGSNTLAAHATSGSCARPTATCRRASRDGRFRGDLYYRIAGWRLQLPPLRERPEDILPLTRTSFRS